MSQPKIKVGILDTGVGASQVVSTDTSGRLPALPSTLTKFKTADTVRNTTVLADDIHLFGWTLEANTYYAIEGYIVTIPTTTAGSPLGAPAYAFKFQESTVSQDSAFCFSSDLSGGDVVPFGSSVVVTPIPAGSPVVGVGFGVVGFVYTNVSAGPTVDFQWAQDVADVDDIALGRGSWIRFTKMS